MKAPFSVSRFPRQSRVGREGSVYGPYRHPSRTWKWLHFIMMVCGLLGLIIAGFF